MKRIVLTGGGTAGHINPAIAVAEEMRKAYADSLAGSVQQVLFEETEGDFATGHAPNYVKVYAKGENLHNEVLPVKITGFEGETLLGEVMA